MTSRRQCLKPSHRVELYPIEIGNSTVVASSSCIQDVHQSIFECNACIDYHCEDHHATIGLSSSLSLQAEMNQVASANMYASSSSSTFPSLMANYENASREIGVSSTLLAQHSSIGQASYQRKRKRTLVECIDFGDKTYRCHHCNALFWLTERLVRSTKTSPSFTSCCSNGKIKLPAAHGTPLFLDKLLNPDNGPTSIKFRRDIRAYNSMFAFTSMGAKINNDVNSHPGPYIFKINGQCHHLMGSLLPVDDGSPTFAQLYMFDTEHEIENRLRSLIKIIVNHLWMEILLVAL